MRIRSYHFKYVLFLILLCFFLSQINAETVEKTADYSPLPMEMGNGAALSGYSGTAGGRFSLHFSPPEGDIVSPLFVFHDIGWNWLNSLFFNFGANFIGAGLGTWAFIETGLDWGWRNVAYNNEGLAYAGLPFLFAGIFMPIVTPVVTYFVGRYIRDTKLQVAAVALAQAFIVTQSFHLPMKLITGRTVPGVISGVFFEPGNTIDDRSEDFSGEFTWFKFDAWDGWPSGHTACAFSAAAVISEIYNDKLWLKISVYTYAFLMGFSVAVNTHWASDSFAGMLIGYAVGKVIGRSFNNLLGVGESRNHLSFYATPKEIGVVLRY